MESPVATTDPAAHTFSQVLFVDIPQSYPPATPVTCRYTLTPALQPQPRDWVGIFKVGWNTTKDYHTFVWVDVGGEQSMTRQVIFNDYYLPKDEIEFYQFCYVDSGGQVRGASTPFCFRKMAEHSLEAGGQDDDLLVVTTQEQVEQSVREKAELQRELDLIVEEKETLKRLLEKQRQEAVSMKDEFEDKDKENVKLMKDIGEVKDQNEKLQSSVEQQQKETEHLKEMLAQLPKQMVTQDQKSAGSGSEEASRQIESHVAKYERALMKINQLEGENEEKRMKGEAQSEEIHTLKSRLRQEEEELFKLRHRYQLLEIDFQSSSREKERLTEEVQTLQSLSRNVGDSQKKEQQSSSNDDLRTLASQLQDTEAALAAERVESKNSRRREELLEEELKELKKELETVVLSCGQAQQKSREHELRLKDVQKEIEDKDGIIKEEKRSLALVRHEKEELTRENQKLADVIQELRRAYSDLQAAAASPDSQQDHVLPDREAGEGAAASIREDSQQGASVDPGDLYESISGVVEQEEELLMCRHCHEQFPFITQDELEAHEQSHRTCPFCMVVCDHMEQSMYEDHVYSHEL